MSDSVVPTPSEKPTCEHNETKWHDFEIYDGGQTPGESPDFRGRCPGPVSQPPAPPVSEPEKCEHGLERPHSLAFHAPCSGPRGHEHDATDEDWCDRCIPDMTAEELAGPPTELVQRAVAHFKTLREPAVSAPTVSDETSDDGIHPELEAFRVKMRARENCVHDVGTYVACRLCAKAMPVSDPTPELRERIANAIFKSDFANVDWELHDHKDAYYRTADAVLVVLGEPK